ncbi:Actin-related protein 2 [Castilleja foliolosa]|uniref:Actin-related protein 2 n=1 Tax=Castilleja foliolosa TaxID=1961234 RepID=A0ABD3EL81_9LAMI
MDNRNVVVCDNGTGVISFLKLYNLREVWLVGRPMLRYEESLVEQELMDTLVGDACLKWRHQLDVSYPVSNGIVQNWDDMGHVWDHAFFSELKVDPTECKILLTDPPLNPSKNREKMVEIMFEKYNFSGVFIQIQAVLTLYAQGLLTGLVIDSGDGVTHVELIDVEGDGMADMVFRCIEEMDIDNRMMLYQHIVLTGGSTMYPGLPSRVKKEISDRYLDVVLKGNKVGLKKLRLRIEDPPRRKHMVYLGGAVLAGIMKDAPEFWISRRRLFGRRSCLIKQVWPVRKPGASQAENELETRVALHELAIALSLAH